MSEIKRFENLRCWQEARKLVKHIFLFAAKGELAKEFTLTNQLKRSSLSAMTNIAEGFSRHRMNDFIRFLDYSQSSSQEVKSLLYVVRDLDLMPDDKITKLQKQCDKTRKLTLGLLNHLKDAHPEYGNSVREEEMEYETSIEECWQIPEELVHLN